MPRVLTHGNCCRVCGSASYRSVVARDEAGRMTASSLYQCSGCSVVFADPKAWREGGSDEVPKAPAPVKSMTPADPSRPVVLPTMPDLSTYGGGRR